jgi:hypothetical protein
MSELLKQQLPDLFRKILDESPENEVFRWIFAQATSGTLTSNPLGFDKFKKIGEYDYKDILQQVIDNDDWGVTSARQDRQKNIQEHTEAVILRGIKTNMPNIHESAVHDVIDNYHSYRYPLLMNFLEKLCATELQGHLRRAIIVRLEPQKQVYPHIDWGMFYLFTDRYHFVLDSEGSRMSVHGEESIWHPGEIWWFNHKITHEAHNDSDKYRIHVIFDVLPYRNVEFLKYIREWTYRSKGISEEIINNFDL